VSRYYRIELTDKDGNPTQFQSFGNNSSLLPLSPGAALETGVITSLLPDGTTNPAALNVEIDIQQMPLHIGDMKSYVRIYGLDLRDIYRTDLNFQNISVRVGMAKGLPLANPKQQGLVVKGAIWQAFGNWMGTDMTLDLVIGAGGLTGKPDSMGDQEQQTFYTFTWKKDQKLGEAIGATINNIDLFKDVKQDFKDIAADRVGTEDRTGYYLTVSEFAQMIQRLTYRQRGKDDQGVLLHLDGQTIKGSDPSSQQQSGEQPIEIDFQDLIGQVTWYEFQKLTCKLVMRGDLKIGGRVKFTSRVPVQTQAQALSSLSPSSPRNTLGIADGATLFIERIHHWGNYRQADAMSWNTTLGLVMLGGAV
jgi:hypothetical protein